MRKVTKLLLTAGALFAFVTGGGVLALARGNVTCPEPGCYSPAEVYMYQNKTATQHTILYVCSSSRCRRYIPLNGWTVTSDHTFVGDSCTKTCECGYTAMVHTRGDRQNVQAATCGKKGYTGDVFCTKCNTPIEKGDFTPATGNHSYALENNKAATCTEDGYTGDEICTVCSDVKSKGNVIKATGHDITVTWNGATATIKCSKGDVDTTATGQKVTYSTKPATCEEQGTETYHFEVTYGGVTYESDQYTEKVGETLGGHDYKIKENSWVWTPQADGGCTVTATVICSRKNCSFEQPAETNTLTVSETNPTCTAAGSRTYLARASLPGHDVIGEDTYTMSIPATGHNYGENPEPVMDWDFSGTNPTATATFTCINANCGHKEVVKFESSQIGQVYQTSCTDEDHTVYTATFTFQGKNYEKTYTVAHPGTTPGHAYIGKWTWAEDPADGATLTLTCSKCNNVETFRAPATKKVTTPATCTTAGEEVYSVSYTYTNPYTNAATPYSDSKTVKLDPLGHDHTGTVTVAFDDDTCQTATATISCIRCSDTVTKPAVVTSVVTKPATCTAPGETTYTAAYGDASTSKTVANIPALGHHFTNTRYNGDSTCEGEGTQTSVCDRCGATDTQTVPGSAGCTLHKVETAQVCPICGKVNGTAALNAVSATADTSASTYGYRLVVRAGTLSNGRKVLTVAFLNAEGQAISLNGTQKIRISLAELNAQLDEDGAQGFAHTLTDLNTANGATGSVSFAVENGTLVLDAAFHNSTASVLLVD